MQSLHQLRGDHAVALLRFERTNREYFAASIGDRGDRYFSEFSDRHHQLLREQRSGTGFYHVIVAADGEIIGRINLIDVSNGQAEMGYRIAEHATGQGIATWAVGQVCDLAAERYGLSAITAGVADENIGSRKVLERNGFGFAGKAVWDEVQGSSYCKDL